MSALTLLKIISWADAYPERKRDAADILFILENCGTKDVLSKLYGSHEHILIEEDYDPTLASVHLLGQEIALLGNVETVRTVKDILTHETDKNSEFKLLSHMGLGSSFQSNSFENTLQLLQKLLQGILDKMPNDLSL